MKKIYYMAFGIAGIVILSIFLPWIHSNNSEYYVYGISLRTGTFGLFAIILSVILLVFKKITAAITLASLSLIYSFSFVFGWIQRAFAANALNVFDGLYIGLFLFLFSLLIYIGVIWKIKKIIKGSNNSNNNVKEKNKFES